MWTRILRELRALAIELFRLVLPLTCVGCGAPDHVMCPRCRAAIAPRIFLAIDDSHLPVWAGAVYLGDIRNVVARWKDHGRADATAHLEHAAYLGGLQLGHVLRSSLARQSTSAPARQSISEPSGTHGVGAGGVSSKIKRIVVVPMPSRAATRRERGFVPGHVVAGGIARALREHALEVEVADVLVMARAKRDNVGLGAKARRANAVHSLRAHPRLKIRTSHPDLVLLVDDVVTTGATLGQAKRVLNLKTGTLAAGYALAATPGDSSSAKPDDKQPS